MSEPTSTTSSPNGTSSAPAPATCLAQREQCWECRRRRLVCDGAQPVCAKCRAARIVCPGYADKKPLTWLAPGQVKSRRRKAPAKGGHPPKHVKNPRPKPIATPTTLPDEPTAEDADGSRTGGLDLGVPVELRPEICDMFEAMLYCRSLLLA